MATKEINLGVNISDKGTGKATEEEVNKVKAALFDATQQAAKFRAETKALKKSLDSISSTEGTAGSRKAAATGQTREHKEFDRNRGVAESSGAAGRDFANQARGLGGLVRLYATFAANLFAVGVAFRGLSQAMDTANMVRGLDQLGAAVGRNLGGLGKRVAELSGGAISLAEALKAVAQTSSAGIAAKDIERLASVARSASAALGVSMPDAIQRLSRGITKLEPELLDELGIMTRLDPAVEIYARQVGKAASQLTQFERRQAFANAVLSEGEEKFGAIADIAVNPYDKLLSAIKDVTQVGGSLINTVLAPLASILASSPAALTAGIVALSAIIAKQALPAIGQFKTGLVEAANEAAEVAKERVGAADAARALLNKDLAQRLAIEQQATEASANAIGIQKQIQVAAIDEISRLRGRAIQKTSLAYQLVNKEAEDVTNAELTRLAARADRLDVRGLEDEAQAYREIGKAIREEQIEGDRADIRDAESAATRNKLEKTTFTSRQNAALALKAQEVATKKNIVSNAAYNAGLIGIKGSYALMNAEIAKANLNLGFFATAALKARASIAILSSVVSVAASSVAKLSNALALVGTVVAAFAILSVMFSRNSAEASQFSSAIDDAEASVANMTRTLAFIDKNASKDTIQGIQSIAEAFDNLSSSITTAVDSAQAKLGKAGLFDKTVDFLKGITPFLNSTKETLNKGLTESISSALKALQNTGLKDEAEMRFKELLGLETLGEKEIAAAIENLSSTAQQGLAKALAAESATLSNASSRLQSFKTASEAANLAYAKFIQTTSNTDPIFVVGAAMQNLAGTMFDIGNSTQLAGEQIEAAIAFLRASPESGALLGENFVKGLIELRGEFKSQEGAITSYAKALKSLDDKISSTPFNELFSDSTGVLEKDLEGLKKGITTVDKLMLDRAVLQEKGVAQAERTRALFVEGLDEAFTRGAKLLETSLNFATERGALAIQKASLSGLSGENLAREQNSIARREIDIRLRSIDTNIDLILSNERLKAALDKNTAVEALASAVSQKKPAGEVTILKEAVNVANIFSELVGKGLPLTIENAMERGASAIEASRIQFQGLGLEQRLAGQRASKIAAEADRTALGISGRINLNKGRLQDQQKELDLASKLANAEIRRVQEAQKLVGVRTTQSVLETIEVQRAAAIIQQKQELLEIDNAILSATSADERIKQESIKASIVERQAADIAIGQAIFTNQLIAVRLEVLSRELEVTKVINAAQASAANNRLKVSSAELNAVSQLFNITTLFTVTQEAAINTRIAQQEFLNKKIAEETDFLIHKEEAELAINAIRAAGGKDAEARVTQVQVELDRQERLRDRSIAIAENELATKERLLEIQRVLTTEQLRQNRLLAAGDKLSSKLGSNFGTVGKAVGGLSKTFSTLAVTLEKNVKAMQVLREAEVAAGNDSKKLGKIQQQIADQQSENNIRTLDGYANAAGAAKEFFKEGTTGYKVLATAEKAYTIVSLALTVQRGLADAAATIASLSHNSARIAGDIAEAEVSGVQAVVNTIASVPFPANLAAGVAVAAVVAALLADIGGKGPKTSTSGFTGEDTQKVQGTGTSFQNGRIVSSSGGALGDESSKVQDIARSIELVENNTSLTSVFGGKSLKTLNEIEANTRNLAAALITGTGITKAGSGFGSTLGKVSSGPNAANVFNLPVLPGVSSIVKTVDKLVGKIPVIGGITKALGGLVSSLFGTSVKTKIIDKGVSASGTLLDLLNTVTKFQEFETLQVTKKKKFFGLSAGSKKKIQENFKDLEKTTNEQFVNLFTDIIDVSISSAQVAFGKSNTSIQDALDTFVIDFKVSGFELSGEEFANAILAESTVIINQLIEQALPVLETFRDLGEGFSATLIRIATGISVATEKLGRFGLEPEKLAGTIKPVPQELLVAEGVANINLGEAISQAFEKGGAEESIDRIIESEAVLSASRNAISEQLGDYTKPIVESLNSAESAFIAANLAIVGNKRAQEELLVVEKLLNNELVISASAKDNARAGITEDVITLFNATKALSTATKAAASTIDNQSLLTISSVTGLINSFGGIEAFVEKTDFVFENFVSESDQLAAKARELTVALSAFKDEGIITTKQFETLTDGIGDSRTEYGELAQSILAAGVTAADSADRIFTLAPAVLEFIDMAENLNPSLGNLVDRLDDFEIGISGISSLLEKAAIGSLEADTIGESVVSQIRDGIFGAMSSSFVADVSSIIVDNMIKPMITGMLVSTTTIDAIVSKITNQANALSAILSNSDFTAALNTITNAITTVITTVNSLARSPADKASDAFAMLSKSIGIEQERLSKEFDTAIKAIDVEIDGLNTSISSITDSVSGLRDISNALKTTIETISPVNLQQARKIITEATQSVISGVAISLDDISSALNVLADTSTSTFSTLFEFKTSQAINANLAKGLNAAVGEQLSAEEQTLQVLTDSLSTAEANKKVLGLGFEEEKSRLDNLLESAGNRLDALKDINASVLSVVKALDNFNIAINIAETDKLNTNIRRSDTLSLPATLTGGGGGGGGGSFLDQFGGGFVGPSKVSDADIRAFAERPNVSSMELYNFGQANNISAARAISVLNLDPNNVTKFLKENKLPGFANGGLTPGGDVLLGELGPEIVSLPKGSRVSTTRETKNMLSNDNLVQEVKSMREDMKALLVVIAESTGKTASKLTKLDILGILTRTA